MTRIVLNCCATALFSIVAKGKAMVMCRAVLYRYAKVGQGVVLNRMVLQGHCLVALSNGKVKS